MVFHRKPPNYISNILDSEKNTTKSDRMAELKRQMLLFMAPKTKKEDLDIPYLTLFSMLNGITYREMYEPRCYCKHCHMMSDLPDWGIEATN